MNYQVFMVDGDELSPEELENQPSNGYGDKEFATYLKVVYDGDVLDIFDANMEPEDVSFHRDLSWVQGALEQAYALGLDDGKEGK